jgi:superfamily II DNA/RNA helicase
MNELKLQGLQRPTAIQSMTWPVLYSGRDIMCIGLPISSRVLSVSRFIIALKVFFSFNICFIFLLQFVKYICPALVFIKEQSIEVRKQGALVLIVTQTKEVAKEILTNAQMFMHQANCSFSCLFDDENVNTQVLHLRDNGKMLFT